MGQGIIINLTTMIWRNNTLSPFPTRSPSIHKSIYTQAHADRHKIRWANCKLMFSGGWCKDTVPNITDSKWKAAGLTPAFPCLCQNPTRPPVHRRERYPCIEDHTARVQRRARRSARREHSALSPSSTCLFSTTEHGADSLRRYFKSTCSQHGSLLPFPFCFSLLCFLLSSSPGLCPGNLTFSRYL